MERRESPVPTDFPIYVHHRLLLAAHWSKELEHSFHGLFLSLYFLETLGPESVTSLREQ